MVYQALARINEAFGIIDNEVARLQNERIMPFEPLYEFSSQELKAGINHKLVDLLKMREERDWGMWQRFRMVRERKLNPELRRRQQDQRKKS